MSPAFAAADGAIRNGGVPSARAAKMIPYPLARKMFGWDAATSMGAGAE